MSELPPSSAASEVPPVEPEPALASTSVPAIPPPQEISYKLYKPSNYATAPRPELPDSYFTPSALELKSAQASLSQRTHGLVDAPLELRSKKDAAAEKSKLERYPVTVIRIRFSDRHMLERSFQSKEKIKNVYSFVRASLREDVKPIKFVLYQTPPIRDLKVSDPKVRDQTLAQLGLAPTSILQLRFPEDSMNSVHYAAPLSPEVMAKAEEFPIPPSPNIDNAAPTLATTVKASASTLGSDAMKKVPKWFKNGLKKK